MNEFERVRTYLTDLQDRICAAIEAVDGQARFQEDLWQRAEGGGGRTRVLRDGAVFEQAGIGFSDGRQPPAAVGLGQPPGTGRRLLARHRRVAGVPPAQSHVPTTHANVRFFQAQRDGEVVASWFGGGFDLTPFYPFDEDVQHWHQVARDLCTPFGDERYAAHKRWCDEYFFLRHRNETRGVGGLFFDDLHGDFERDFAYLRAVGDGFLDAYLPIVQQRKGRIWRARTRVPAVPPRPLRGVQPGLRPRHPVRAAERWPQRKHPDEPAAAGALVRLHPEAGSAEARLAEPGATRLALIVRRHA